MLAARQGIFVCALSLLTLGVVMVASAGMRIVPATAEAPVASPEGFGVQSLLGGRNAVFAGIAIAAMLFAWSLPRWLAVRLSTPRPDRVVAVSIVGVAACLVLLGSVYIGGLSREMNASHRWIEVTLPAVGTLSIQPSELVKWGLVGLLAWAGASAGPLLARFWTGFLPAFAALGLVAGVIMLEDLGTAVLIAGVGSLVLLAAGAKLTHAAWVAPLGLAAVVPALIFVPYRMARLTAFVDPYADPAGTGFHMIQSMGAVAGGEGAGRGLGHGLQKFGYLPEDTTDFIFAIICEELGIPGALLVLSLYAALLACLWVVLGRAENPIHRLFVLGVMATIGLQASINLLVVTGLAPTKGIALPLISKGGTGWILTAFSLGLVAAIDRHADEQRASEPENDEDPYEGAYAAGLPA
ncbi:MAG: FtsW/RodA/SpoVE family cell cycle protein [Planctomycetota bacterium]